MLSRSSGLACEVAPELPRVEAALHLQREADEARSASEQAMDEAAQRYEAATAPPRDSGGSCGTKNS
jgi:hypothetical protein